MSEEKPVTPAKPDSSPGTPIKKSPAEHKPVEPVPSSSNPGTPQKFSENG
jgi:hypothetical protein